MKTLVLGIGNAWRGDDGAGPAVLQRLAELGAASERAELALEPGDGARIMDRWQGYQRVWIVDAAHSGAAPGSIHRLDAGTAPLPATLLYASSHLFGVSAAIETARALQRLPETLIVHAIEGERFTHGQGLSSAVALAVGELADGLLAELIATSLPVAP